MNILINIMFSKNIYLNFKCMVKMQVNKYRSVNIYMQLCVMNLLSSFYLLGLTKIYEFNY